jgi:hypothetical protein
MQGKIFAIALIILGVYILNSVLFGKGDRKDESSSAELYHIGCYDIDRPLSHSSDLRQYISNLTLQFNQTSARKIATINAKI